MDKDEIKSLYAELIGCLGQTPPADGIHATSMVINDDNAIKRYNDTIKILNDVTGKNYDRFLLYPGRRYDLIHLSTYRQTLGAIISKLHAEYFSDLPEPFSGKPTTLLRMDQQQNQSAFIEMLLDLQARIDEKMPTLLDGSDEKTFLVSLKRALRNVSCIADIIGRILKLAGQFELTPERIANLLKFT